MISFLKEIKLSADSKSLINKNYLKRLSENKLRIIYSAVKSSKDKSKNFFDIQIDKNIVFKNVEKIDILTYSFPCQDLSVQGLHKGMSKKSNTRSALLWQIDDLLNQYFKNDKKRLPKILLLENVKNICSKTHLPELLKWFKRLEKYGYKNSYGVLNSKDFGSCQSRERFFCISSLHKKIDLPMGNPDYAKPFKNIIEKNIPDKYSANFLKEYHNKDFRHNKKSNISKLEMEDYTTYHSENFLYNPEFSMATLTASGANSRLKFLKNKQYRYIQPIEAWRLMGFSKKDFNKVNKMKLLSDSKMIYLAGNSISIEVLKAIFKKILDEYEKF